jgi:hypothetical protein
LRTVRLWGLVAGLDVSLELGLSDKGAGPVLLRAERALMDAVVDQRAAHAQDPCSFRYCETQIWKYGHGGFGITFS